MEALLAGHTVVTASHRLARELQLNFADFSGGREAVWERPSILAWPDWLQGLWQSIAWSGHPIAGRRLLGQGQFQLVWEQIIRKSEGEGLLQTGAAARQASKAWELANGWDLPWARARELASEDAARFLDWSDAYRETCEEAGWIDRSQLAAVIRDYCHGSAEAPVSGPILLAGFDELTPQQQGLIEALEQGGLTVNRWLPARDGQSISKRALTDSETELTAAASWCLASLRADPTCSIGVVVPDLSDRHDEVSRVFQDILVPGACEGVESAGEQVFSLSAGPQLLHHPMIAAALGIIEMMGSVPAWSRMSYLLRSQFLGEAQQEGDGRAALDAMLRAEGGTRWTLADIARRLRVAIDQEADSACPALLARIERAMAQRAGFPKRQDTHGWVQAISGWLEAFGWPGERTLNSSEFQLLARWRELLEEIAAYEVLLGQTTLGSVLALVRRLSADARFKPESGRCAVQVLGVLEAAGLEFDKLWVCGLHDGAWPPAPAPTAFLPFRLQRALGMPRSCSARELKIARQQLTRLVNSADEVRLSWPESEGDQEQRASPLIEEFEEDVGNEERFGERAAELFALRPKPETLADDEAPELDRPEAVKGGTRVLELQAWCPFRAFAELRLYARPLEQPAAGLDAINRGSIAHEALYELWKVLGDQMTLAGLDAEGRRAVVRRSIRKAIESLESGGNALMQRLLALETERLESLIETLLLKELERPPFQVEMLEQRKTVEVGPLRLSTRLDRLDMLGDGGRLVIDYKTGAVSPGRWFGSRPGAPQLPLYASGLSLDHVRGLAFVSLSSAAVKFSGVCDAADEMPAGVRPPTRAQWAAQGVTDWPALLVGWRETLGRLAADFQAGKSKVDPLADACRTCHLHALCRVDEQQTRVETSDDV